MNLKCLDYKVSGVLVVLVVFLTWGCEGRAWFRNPMGQSSRARMNSGNSMDYYRYRKTVDVDPFEMALPPLLFPPASRSFIKFQTLGADLGDGTGTGNLAFPVKRSFGWGPSVSHIGSWRDNDTGDLAYQQARDNLKERAVNINMLCSYFSSVSCLGRRVFAASAEDFKK
ncbi:uncharacterized protein LOC129587178 [Paramacrobiotus metropolitanus]|uniref:uncharacterized protein LOC129587178 n=1 Tax=Paramacrobiotus metropolitanus TaxID=2943436 RepID=UPI002445B76B|nr:uncharacterized protein LOC129587178 [Paramacrobiotus metropolitanus]